MSKSAMAHNLAAAAAPSRTSSQAQSSPVCPPSRSATGTANRSAWPRCSPARRRKTEPALSEYRSGFRKRFEFGNLQPLDLPVGLVVRTWLGHRAQHVRERVINQIDLPAVARRHVVAGAVDHVGMEEYDRARASGDRDRVP